MLVAARATINGKAPRFQVVSEGIYRLVHPLNGSTDPAEAIVFDVDQVRREGGQLSKGR